MARGFDDGSSQYLEGTSLVTGTPISIAAVFQTDSLTLRQVVASVGDDSDNDMCAMAIRGDVLNDPLEAYTYGGAGAKNAQVASVLSTNTWHYGLAVFASTSSRTIYCDGVNTTTNTDNTSVADLDQVRVARATFSFADLYLSGMAGEVAIWNVALTAADALILAAGYSPLFVKPENLVHYYPLIRDGDQDRVSGQHLADSGSPTIVDHPAVIYPATSMLSYKTGATTSTSTSTSTTTTSSSTSTSTSTTTTTTLAPTGGLAFGEESPTEGETAVSWQTWSDGAAGTPTIDGDSDWGKLELNFNEEGRSAVYDFGNSDVRTYTLTENRYGAGQEDATLQIRGDTSTFAQDDVNPAWTTYSAPLDREWRYVQVREIYDS